MSSNPQCDFSPAWAVIAPHRINDPADCSVEAEPALSLRKFAITRYLLDQLRLIFRIKSKIS